MPVQVILSATLRKYREDYDPLTGILVDVDPGTTVRDLMEKLGIPPDEVKLIMVDGVASSEDRLLQGEERVAFFPPVGGG